MSLNDLPEKETDWLLNQSKLMQVTELMAVLVASLQLADTLLRALFIAHWLLLFRTNIHSLQETGISAASPSTRQRPAEHC